MKKAAGSVRIDLAQYREMEVFTQFSSDLDDATKAQLAYGKSLMELLKQPLYRPLSMAEQVISLVVATNKLLTDVPQADIKKTQMGILDHIASYHPDILRALTESGQLTDETRESILAAAKEYKAGE